MIELIGITKHFDDRKLFEDFNLTIQENEFVAFSGPSGAGKTTLLNIIGGIEAPDYGQVIVDGLNIYQKKNLYLYYREKVGFLFQNFALIENKTVKENLQLVHKNSREKISIEESLAEVHLEHTLNKKVYTLSGGEQQRIVLARLMLKKCSFILADEPTGSLDEGNAEIVMTILEKLNQQGKTIILVTHDENIKKRAKRVIQL